MRTPAIAGVFLYNTQLYSNFRGIFTLLLQNKAEVSADILHKGK